MADKPPISLWDRSAQESDYSNRMDGDTTTELAIVGGGFTGLSTALHAAERGIDCLVLEAEHLGFGGSGRNVGLVNAGLWLPPQDVRAKLGKTRGAPLIERLSRAPDDVFGLIEKHQIRCEATRTGTIHAAHAPRGYGDLARRAEEWKRLGAPVELLTRDQVTRKIGSPVFHGGLLDHRAGTINPMGYVRGLARAALGAGARVFTGTRVRRLQRKDDRWLLTTDRGTVTAKSVVLGTNAYSDSLWPGLKTSFVIIHYFQVATEPLGHRVDHILSERQGMWDTGRIMFSMRRDAYGRLLIGSMGQVIGGKKGLTLRWAKRTLKRLFPDLGRVEFDEAWHGQIAMTPDHLPRVHRLADNLYTPICYNGRGIAPGTVFGRAMAELLAGGREEDLPLPISAQQSVPGRRLTAAVLQTAFSANQWLKSF